MSSLRVTLLQSFPWYLSEHFPRDAVIVIPALPMGKLRHGTVQ